MLDKRLKACADFVSGKGIACDVGTDHAYLSKELILNGKCSYVIASDINSKPLEFAQNTVNKYNIQDKVKLILSDGLKEVPSDNVTDVIIAGMGGETIIDIISNAEWLRNGVNLILQPMTKAPELRKWLYANGYKISQEKAVEDGKFIYTVMKCVYCGDSVRLLDLASVIGQLDVNDDVSREYMSRESHKLEKIAEGLRNAGDIKGYAEKSKLAGRIGLLALEKRLGRICIYETLDRLYPFSHQEKWDNSGYLVGNRYRRVNKIMLSLDITNDTVFEARAKGCDIIISHHPVIFEPIKSINENSVVYHLIQNDISAICMHTNLDIAPDGTNGVILEKLSERFSFYGEPEPFEKLGDGLSLGRICTLEEEVNPEKFGSVLKEIFGCDVVRFCNRKRYVRRIAFCSGSGGSMLSEAMAKGCDTLITGDVKHDVWISAINNNMNIFDCGHFHTENIVLEHIKNVLDANFPFIETVIAETSEDPVKYIK